MERDKQPKIDAVKLATSTVDRRAKQEERAQSRRAAADISKAAAKRPLRLSDVKNGDRDEKRKKQIEAHFEFCVCAPRGRETIVFADAVERLRRARAMMFAGCARYLFACALHDVKCAVLGNQKTRRLIMKFLLVSSRASFAARLARSNPRVDSGKMRSWALVRARTCEYCKV